VIASKNSFYR